MRHFYSTLAALMAALVLLPAASAATITVDTLADEMNVDGDCSLREAIASANMNASVDNCAAGAAGSDEIVFGLTATGTVTLAQSAFVITEDVTIRGGVAGLLNTISGGDTYRLFDVTSGTLALNSIVLTNGLATSGAGVYVRSGAGLNATTVTFQNHVATGGAASEGGAAIYNEGGTVRLQSSMLVGNVANGASGSGGAVLNNGGQLTVMQSTFSGNASMRAGGAIEVRGDAASTQISGTAFATNTAGSSPGNGGAIHVTGASSSSITGGTVSGNTAAREGGGFWNDAGTMALTAVEFSNNEAQGPAADDGGGALFNNGGTMVVTGGSISSNRAVGMAGSGGGILTLGGTLAVSGTLIDGNVANRAGAGVESAGASTTLTDVTVDGNDIPAATAMPGNGGGVHAGGGTLTVIGGVYTANDATEGGALWANGTLIVQPNGSTGTRIEGNTGRGADAANGGGGIYVETGGTATVGSAMISQNAATGMSGSGGGVLVAPGARATLTDVTIMGNRANRAGAGIEVAGGTLTLVGATVGENVIPAATARPGNGGGLHAGGGVVRISTSTFTANEATEGGGVWSNGVLTIGTQGEASDVTTLSGNVGRGDDASNGGGGVYAETGADMVIVNALINDNQATGTAGSGGGILVADGASVRVVASTLSGNQANRAGAGIEVADDGATSAPTAFEIVWSTVSDNVIVTAAPGNGGGLHIGGAGAVIVSRSLFAGNTAREGGGLWAAGPSSLRIENSTVSGNEATEDGGGVYDNGGARVSVDSGTIALNVAGGNGGGFLSQSTDRFTFVNTAVGGNMATAGTDCSGTVVSGDYNLVQSVTGCTIVGNNGNNIIGEDPMLGPLADNGGPTMTHEPMGGSPLVNAGQTDLFVDQRSFSRTVGQDDIGAVERGVFVADEDAPVGDVLSMTAARPNPVRGVATLAFTVAEAGEARVELYNVLGQRVMILFEGSAQVGTEQTVRLDASSLAPGVYVARLQSGGVQATQRVTIVR